VQPLLPQPEQWQVVCYQNGVLMLTGENQALVSQLAYLQKQYIAQLSQIHELKELNKIQVRLRHPSQTALAPENRPNHLAQKHRISRAMLLTL
jgi:hypothetical protein